MVKKPKKNFPKNTIISPYSLLEGHKLIVNWNDYRPINSEELNSFLLSKKERTELNSTGSIVEVVAGAEQQGISILGQY
jgi:hypothetical protein